MPAYREIAASEVPSYVRFDTPARCRGQSIEVSYGGVRRFAHDEGSPYMRIIDWPSGTVRYFRLDRCAAEDPEVAEEFEVVAGDLQEAEDAAIEEISRRRAAEFAGA